MRNGGVARGLGYAVNVQSLPGSRCVRVDVFDRWHNEESATVPLITLVESARGADDVLGAVVDECATRLFIRLHHPNDYPEDEGEGEGY